MRKEEGAADVPFDLLLTVTEGNAYYGCNGGATDEDGTLVTYGRYGSISVHGGSTAKVTVELVDPTTGGKVIVPNFYLSFYDLDGDGDSDAYKSIELADYESVTLSSPTNVVVDDAGTTFRACGVATDCGAATAADGTTENLPTEPSSASPLELTAEQLECAARLQPAACRPAHQAAVHNRLQPCASSEACSPMPPGCSPALTPCAQLQLDALKSAAL